MDVRNALVNVVSEATVSTSKRGKKGSPPTTASVTGIAYYDDKVQFDLVFRWVFPAAAKSGQGKKEKTPQRRAQ